MAHIHIKNLEGFFGGALSLEGGDNYGKMGFLECPCYIHVVCLEPFVSSSYYGYISCPAMLQCLLDFDFGLL